MDGQDCRRVGRGIERAPGFQRHADGTGVGVVFRIVFKTGGDMDGQLFLMVRPELVDTTVVRPVSYRQGTVRWYSSAAMTVSV